MQPFRVSPPLEKLVTPYPDARDLLTIASQVTSDELEAIVRLWISEGIPFAFRQTPAVYEILRRWIAQRLEIHPKEITLVGSARLGSSAAPAKVGVPFGRHSDLDWAAISETLFTRCFEEFDRWSRDYRNCEVTPSAAERRYWDSNLTAVPRNIASGFIDLNRIPLRRSYPTARSIGETMWLVCQRAAETQRSPEFRKSTIRVYRDWSCFVRQARISLQSASSRYAATPKPDLASAAAV